LIQLSLRVSAVLTPFCHSTGTEIVIPTTISDIPPDSEILSTEPHGTSFWAETGRIDVKLADDSIQTFFIKVLSHENGRSMVNGEFESMTALQNIVPGSVPRPIAWGSYETVPDTYFFLCEFRDMTGDLPDEKNFTSCLAKIHMNSQSPTGKFGFHVPTYGGTLSQENEWSDSWEAFFAKGMRHTLEYEILAHGPTTELANLSAIIFDKVIPRLLRPLESEGRSVKPCLVHGDLWYANTSTDATKDETIVFDACSLYAHNECMKPSLSSNLGNDRD
jgi:fructosamine-3-kinase